MRIFWVFLTLSCLLGLSRGQFTTCTESVTWSVRQSDGSIPSFDISTLTTGLRNEIFSQLDQSILLVVEADGHSEFPQIMESLSRLEELRQTVPGLSAPAVKVVVLDPFRIVQPPDTWYSYYTDAALVVDLIISGKPVVLLTSGYFSTYISRLDNTAVLSQLWDAQLFWVSLGLEQEDVQVLYGIGDPVFGFNRHAISLCDSPSKTLNAVLEQCFVDLCAQKTPSRLWRATQSSPVGSIDCEQSCSSSSSNRDDGLVDWKMDCFVPSQLEFSGSDAKLLGALTSQNQLESWRNSGPDGFFDQTSMNVMFAKHPQVTVVPGAGPESERACFGSPYGVSNLASIRMGPCDADPSVYAELLTKSRSSKLNQLEEYLCLDIPRQARNQPLCVIVDDSVETYGSVLGLDTANSGRHTPMEPDVNIVPLASIEAVSYSGTVFVRILAVMHFSWSEADAEFYSDLEYSITDIRKVFWASHGSVSFDIYSESQPQLELLNRGTTGVSYVFSALLVSSNTLGVTELLESSKFELLLSDSAGRRSQRLLFAAEIELYKYCDIQTEQQFGYSTKFYTDRTFSDEIALVRGHFSVQNTLDIETSDTHTILYANCSLSNTDYDIALESIYVCLSTTPIDAKCTETSQVIHVYGDNAHQKTFSSVFELIDHEPGWITFGIVLPGSRHVLLHIDWEAIPLGNIEDIEDGLVQLPSDGPVHQRVDSILKEQKLYQSCYPFPYSRRLYGDHSSTNSYFDAGSDPTLSRINLSLKKPSMVRQVQSYPHEEGEGFLSTSSSSSSSSGFFSDLFDFSSSSTTTEERSDVFPNSFGDLFSGPPESIVISVSSENTSWDDDDDDYSSVSPASPISSLSPISLSPTTSTTTNSTSSSLGSEDEEGGGGPRRTDRDRDSHWHLGRHNRHGGPWLTIGTIIFVVIICIIICICLFACCPDYMPTTNRMVRYPTKKSSKSTDSPKVLDPNGSTRERKTTRT